MLSSSASMLHPLDEELDLFTDPLFVPEHAARVFFSTSSEVELNRKLNDLSRKQIAVERILKQKVRENYKSFLFANNEVASVGQDMEDLTELVEQISEYVGGIRANRENETVKHRLKSKTVNEGTISAASSSQLTVKSKGTKTTRKSTGSSTIDEVVTNAMIRTSSNSLMKKYGELDMDSDGMSTLSSEIRNAPYDLHRFIVEQQYSEAVKLIVKMRAYHRERLNATVNKGNTHGEGSASLLALGVLMKRIETSSGQLAETLMASMAEALPANSPLWGPAELRLRLQLLIQLGRVDLAAEGYLSSQAVVLARVVSVAVADIGTITSDSGGRVSESNGGQGGVSPRNTSAMNVRGGIRSTISGNSSSSSGSGTGSRPSGIHLPPDESTHTNIHAATTDYLCRAFTNALFESCSSFLVLFKAQQASDPGIASTLLLWTQNQLAWLVSSLLFSSQLQLGFDTCADRAIMALRRCSSNTSNNSDSSSSSSGSGSSNNLIKSATEGKTGSDSDTLRLNVSGDRFHLHRMNIQGPLSFLAGACLDVAFAAVARLDDLGLHGRVTLGWLCLTDVQRLVMAFTEVLLKEATLETRQDTWAPVQMTSSTVSPKTNVSSHGGLTSTENEGNTGVVVSGSCRWMFYALQHFLEEVKVLVKLDGTKGDDVDRKETSVDLSNPSNLSSQVNKPMVSNQSSHGKTSVDPSSSSSSTTTSTPTIKSKSYYSREDFCEVEPTIVTCLLRLCVRYVAEIEAVDRSGFTHAQQQCYAITLRIIDSGLLATVGLALDTMFFYDNSLSSSSHHTVQDTSPRTVLYTLSTRVQRMLCARDLAGKEHDGEKLLAHLAMVAKGHGKQQVTTEKKKSSHTKTGGTESVDTRGNMGTGGSTSISSGRKNGEGNSVVRGSGNGSGNGSGSGILDDNTTTTTTTSTSSVLNKDNPFAGPPIPINTPPNPTLTNSMDIKGTSFRFRKDDTSKGASTKPTDTSLPSSSLPSSSLSSSLHRSGSALDRRFT